MLAIWYSFSQTDCDGYLSRAENKEPQPSPWGRARAGTSKENPRPEPTESKVEENLMHAGEPVSSLTQAPAKHASFQVASLSEPSAYHHLRTVKLMPGLALAKHELITF